MKAQRYQFQDLTPAETTEVLDSQVSAVLAFVDSEGYPRQVPCWFLYDGERFFVTSIVGKFHVRKLAANPKASICVEVDITQPADDNDEERRGHWQVKGVGDVVIYPDSDGAVGDRIRHKYLGDKPLPVPAQDRVVIELTPRKISAHGGGIKVSKDAV